MARRQARSRAEKIGLPPGTLIHVGKVKSEQTTISAVIISDSGIEELEVKDAKQALSCRGRGRYVWVNVNGLADLDAINQIGEGFDLHPLALEDVVNPNQRPKREEYPQCLYIVLKALRVNGQRADIDAEQISIFLGKDYVLSFQEMPADAFASVRQRMQNPSSRIRARGPDYLTYALIDYVVDGYFAVMERTGEALEELEGELVASPEQCTLARLYALKRRGLLLRKMIWPLREVIAALEREGSELIQPSTAVFLRDVYSHVVEAIETVETFREALSGMLDVYLSSASNRLNSVMKVLTIFTTVCMPLSVLAGVYGMNFKYMPELDYPYSYPLVLLAMLLIAVAMIAFFKHRRWL